MPERSTEAWYRISHDSVLPAARHVFYMAQSLVTVFGEMKLPKEKRAGYEEDISSDSGPNPLPQPMSADEQALKRCIQECQQKAVMTIADVRKDLSSRQRGHENMPVDRV